MKKNVITLFCSISAINKAKSVSHVQHKGSRALLRSVYTEHQRQRCDVVSDITLIKVFEFHNKKAFQ